MKRKPVSYGSGSYHEISNYPLQDLNNIEELDKYQWPAADWWNISNIKQKINNINENKNSIKKLKNIIEIQLKLFSENPLMTAITFQEEIFREYPEIWSKFNSHREKREKLIKNIIKEGKKKGEIKDLIDPESFTSIFMGTIRMTVIEWRGSNFEFSILEKGKKIFSQLEEFLKKR